jgi:hypothetical protein
MSQSNQSRHDAQQSAARRGRGELADAVEQDRMSQRSRMEPGA